MFDIGFMELCLIGVVALLVVGPERLPRLARTAGMWAGRARRFMSDVKADISAEMREQDLGALKDIKNDLQQARTELEQTSEDLNKGLSDDDIMQEIQRPQRDAATTPSTRAAPGKKAKRAPAARKTAKKAKKKSTAGRKTSTAAGKKTRTKKTAKKKTSTGKKKTAQKSARRGKQ